MTTTRIACCIDFSPCTRTVLREATLLAQALNATLVLFHAVKAEEGDAPQVDVNARTRMLDEELARVRAEGVSCEGYLVVDEHPAEAVLRQVEQHAITRLVVGSHGRAMVFELLVGSFTQAILRNAHVPVVVVPIPREE